MLCASLLPPVGIPADCRRGLVRDQAKRFMGRVLQLASFSLAEVTYTTGDIGYQVQESVRQASYTVKARAENVSGVVLPAFEGS